MKLAPIPCEGGSFKYGNCSDTHQILDRNCSGDHADLQATLPSSNRQAKSSNPSARVALRRRSHGGAKDFAVHTKCVFQGAILAIKSDLGKPKPLWVTTVSEGFGRNHRRDSTLTLPAAKSFPHELFTTGFPACPQFAGRAVPKPFAGPPPRTDLAQGQEGWRL